MSKMYHIFHFAKIITLGTVWVMKGVPCWRVKVQIIWYVDIANVVCEISSRIEPSISSSPFKLVNFDGIIPVIKFKSCRDSNSSWSSCQRWAGIFAKETYDTTGCDFIRLWRTEGN